MCHASTIFVRTRKKTSIEKTRDSYKESDAYVGKEKRATLVSPSRGNSDCRRNSTSFRYSF